MAFEQERMALAENEAKKVSLSFKKVMGTKVLVRQFPKIVDPLRESSARFLDSYASAMNATATDLVYMPYADNKRIPGWWKQILVQDGRLRQGDQGQGIFQTLVPYPSDGNAFGFWSQRDSAEDQYQYQGFGFYQPKTAPTSATGSFWAVGNTFDQETGTYNYQANYTAEIPSSVAFRSAYSVFRTGNKIVYRNWGSAITAPDCSAGGAYSVENSFTRGGYYNADLVYQYSTLGTAGVTFASTRSKLEDTDRTIYRGSPTVIAAPASIPGRIYTANSSFNEELGGYDGNREDTTEKGASVSFRAAASAFQISDRIVYRNWSTNITAPAAGGGYQYRVDNAFTSGGYYNADLVYVAALGAGSATPFAALRSALESKDRTIYRGSPTVIVAPTSIPGRIYEASNTFNLELSGYDANYDDTTEIGKNAAFGSTQTCYSMGNTVVYRNWNVPITTPTPVLGGFYRVSNSFTQGGYYNADWQYEARQPAWFWWTFPTRFGTGYGYQYSNWSTVPSLTMDTNTYIPSFHPNLQLDTGLYDTTCTFTPFNATGDTWQVFAETVEFVYDRQFKERSGFIYNRRLYYQLGHKVTESRTGAEQFIAQKEGGDMSVDSGGVIVSHYKHLLGITTWSSSETEVR
jgi:hypothetical protein